MPEAVLFGRVTQRPPAVPEIDIVWMTAGLGCDGDSVSITAATQPSIQDLLLGAIPGLPKVHLHNPVLAYENGGEFLKYWYMETVYLLFQVAGLAPMIQLDAVGRPIWLFGKTVHEGCDRAGYYEQGDFATEYGSHKCIVKLGYRGPVVNCNVSKRGWLAGIGGCPNVGGICIGCTMPGFPDKFMPFMDEPPGGKISTVAVGIYGRIMSALRAFTNATLDVEPKWRHSGIQLNTGYHPKFH